MSRISRDEWGLRLATVTAERGTCLRRQVGCVLVDELGHVLATGYNGVAAGLPHCNEQALENSIPTTDPDGAVKVTFYRAFPHACPGANLPSGTGLDMCEAIHAEQNALIQCRDHQAIRTCYVTVSPCIHCVKMLMNTGCRVIVSREPYSHDTRARDLWHRDSARLWVHHPAS